MEPCDFDSVAWARRNRTLVIRRKEKPWLSTAQQSRLPKRRIVQRLTPLRRFRVNVLRRLWSDWIAMAVNHILHRVCHLFDLTVFRPAHEGIEVCTGLLGNIQILEDSWSTLNPLVCDDRSASIAHERIPDNFDAMIWSSWSVWLLHAT